MVACVQADEVPMVVPCVWCHVVELEHAVFHCNF